MPLDHGDSASGVGKQEDMVESIAERSLVLAHKLISLVILPLRRQLHAHRLEYGIIEIFAFFESPERRIVRNPDGTRRHRRINPVSEPAGNRQQEKQKHGFDGFVSLPRRDFSRFDFVSMFFIVDEIEAASGTDSRIVFVQFGTVQADSEISGGRCGRYPVNFSALARELMFRRGIFEFRFRSAFRALAFQHGQSFPLCFYMKYLAAPSAMKPRTTGANPRMENASHDVPFRFSNAVFRPQTSPRQSAATP